MGPLVSVVVTTYNQAPYIAAALESVLGQTYRPLELIVVDDGSTDETPAAIAPFMESCRYVRQKNRGVAPARNRGVELAKGRYVAFLDGDDLWEPEQLSVQVSLATQFPGAGMVVVDGGNISERGTREAPLIRAPVWEMIPGECGRVSGDRCVVEFLLHGNLVPTTSQVMVPAEVLERIGPSDERCNLASDYDLYLRIASRYDVVFTKGRLTWWRFLATSASGPTHLRRFRWARDEITVLRKHMKLSPPERRGFIRRLLKRKIATITEATYYRGLEGERMWATSYLAGLVGNGVSWPWALVFLTALWCPGRLRKVLARRVRRMVKSPDAVSVYQ